MVKKEGESFVTNGIYLLGEAKCRIGEANGEEVVRISLSNERQKVID